MKVSALILASALGLVAAAPIRIIVVPMHAVAVSSTEPRPHIQVVDNNPFNAVRIGHAGAAAASRPTIQVPAWSQGPTPHPCGGLRAKMDRLSDKARELLGLPPLDRQATRVTWTASSGYRVTQGWTEPHRVTEHHAMLWKDGKPRYHKGHAHHDKFSHRLHRALNQLGPWEGRALSFVLGCGIGVLLRMVFVLCVLLVRARRAATATPAAPTGPIHLVADEVIFVAPPEYIDEKVPVYSPAGELVGIVEEKEETTPAPASA